MSMQLYLVFDSKGKLEYIAEKYNWDESQYYVIEDEYLSDYCICSYHGHRSYTDGIGEYDVLTYSMLGSSKYLLHKSVSDMNYRTVDELTETYYAAIETLNNAAKWARFVSENISYLNNIGFLLHWDVADDFSDVVFSKKEYSRLEINDFLMVQENVVLWITNE